MVTTVRHRGLAVAAACVALPAVGGAVSLANGTIDPGTAIVDRFPWQSVELAGLANVLTKCIGSNNPNNMVRATMAALRQLQPPDQVAALRGKTVAELRG